MTCIHICTLQPFFLSSDGRALGIRNILANERTGLNATRTPAFIKILFIFSETPLTYGIHVEPRIFFSPFRFLWAIFKTRNGESGNGMENRGMERGMEREKAESLKPGTQKSRNL